MPTIKQLIPSVIRERLRPWYHSMTRQWGRYADRWRPAPARLKQLRQHLRQPLVGNDSAELYQIAQREFGVLQVEQEIVPVLDYIADHHPQVIGEIGLKHGGNSFLFTQRCRQATLYVGVDLKLENTFKLQYLAPDELKVRLFEGSSYSSETVQRVSKMLGPRKFDFLFIDGDHSWHGAREDFLRYLPLMQPGGLVGFHDIVPDEVARFGKKQPTSQCYGGDVYLLWEKLKQRFEHREFVASWDQIGFGIGILRLPTNPLTQADMTALEQHLS